MTDPAHDDVAAAIRAITGLVTGPPNLIGFDFADLRLALFEQGRAVDAAFADLKHQLRQ